MHNSEIQSFIYIIRDKQIILDSDLAKLYQVETGAINRAVKRNIKRFPDEFCFQLTKEEYVNLIYQSNISNIAATDEANLECQSGISSLTIQEISSPVVNSHGGRRSLPYAFNEQGIAMLSSVLHSDTAITVSINIMNAFVEMRKFIANNALMFDKISSIELKQMEYQKKADENFERIFQYIEDRAEAPQKLFYDGQIFDAYSFFVKIIEKARVSIIIIDNYVDLTTLDLLSKKKAGVHITLYTLSKTKLTLTDISTFNAQYPSLQVNYNNTVHDRFIVIDNIEAYHVGASLKDAGKKCFGINKIENIHIVQDLIHRL